MNEPEKAKFYITCFCILKIIMSTYSSYKCDNTEHLDNLIINDLKCFFPKKYMKNQLLTFYFIIFLLKIYN
jgi:hypothetical protein